MKSKLNPLNFVTGSDIHLVIHNEVKTGVLSAIKATERQLFFEVDLADRTMMFATDHMNYPVTNLQNPNRVFADVLQARDYIDGFLYVDPVAYPQVRYPRFNYDGLVFDQNYYWIDFQNKCRVLKLTLHALVERENKCEGLFIGERNDHYHLNLISEGWPGSAHTFGPQSDRSKPQLLHATESAAIAHQINAMQWSKGRMAVNQKYMLNK